MSASYPPAILCRGVYSFRRSVRMSCSWNYFKVLRANDFEWSISHQRLVRKHSYLDHRYPGGSAFIPWLFIPGPMSRGGARSKSRTPLKRVFFYFPVMESAYANSRSDMAQPCDMDLRVMKWSAWHIFHGPVILSYILKTIWCMYIIFCEYESEWPNVWPQN